MMPFCNYEVTSADDRQVFHNDLTQLTECEERWLMSFNPSKCEVLTVTHKKQPILCNYSIHDQNLNSALNISAYSLDFKWNKHISQITGKAKPDAGLCEKKHQHMVTYNTKTKAYKTLVPA